MKKSHKRIIGKYAIVCCLQEQLNSIGLGGGDIFPGMKVKIVAFEMHARPLGEWYMIDDERGFSKEWLFAIPLIYLDVI